MRHGFILLLVLASGTFASASSISSSAASLQLGFGGVTATSVADAMLGSQLAGATVTANFTQGGGQQCTFVLNVCTAANSSFSLTAGVGDTGSGIFSLSTTQGAQGGSLSTLIFSLAGANAAFNPCVTGGALGSSCASSSAGAGTATSVVGAGSGTGSAMVYYVGQVKLPGGAISSDLYNQINLIFGGAGLSTGTLFTFAGDTDLLNGSGSVDPPPSTTPEPTTIGLVGASLIGLAGLKLRRSNKA